jgi:hypothetical protein
VAERRPARPRIDGNQETNVDVRKSAYVALLAASGAAAFWLRQPQRTAPPPERESVPRFAAPVVTKAARAHDAAPARTSRDASGAPAVPFGGPPDTPMATASAAREQAQTVAPRAETIVQARPVPLSGAPEGVRKLLLWAAADPAAATVWADQRSDPTQRREALQVVCSKIAEQDPRGALDMAETFGLTDASDVVENLVAQWAATDADAALAWAAQRPADDERDALIARIAFVLSASNPWEAAHVIESRLAPGPTQADAVAALIQRWSNEDGASASAWAANLPAGPLRVRARQELASLGSLSH